MKTCTLKPIKGWSTTKQGAQHFINSGAFLCCIKTGQHDFTASGTEGPTFLRSCVVVVDVEQMHHNSSRKH